MYFLEEKLLNFLEKSLLYMLVLVTDIMWKPLLLYVLGLLCIDNLTKCNTISIFQKIFEVMMSENVF